MFETRSDSKIFPNLIHQTKTENNAKVGFSGTIFDLSLETDSSRPIKSKNWWTSQKDLTICKPYLMWVTITALGLMWYLKYICSHVKVFQPDITIPFGIMDLLPHFKYILTHSLIQEKFKDWKWIYEQIVQS